MTQWHPATTIPMHRKVQIKTATGMIRIAICKSGNRRDGKAYCWSRDRRTTGDLVAVAWREIE